MSAYNIAFINAPTAPLAVTTTSARVAYPIASNLLVISNLGSSAAYLKSGNSSVVAVVDTNFAIPAGAIISLRRDPTDTHIAAITSASTTNLSISCTEGK